MLDVIGRTSEFRLGITIKGKVSSFVWQQICANRWSLYDEDPSFEETVLRIEELELSY